MIGVMSFHFFCLVQVWETMHMICCRKFSALILFQEYRRMMLVSGKLWIDWLLSVKLRSKFHLLAKVIAWAYWKCVFILNLSCEVVIRVSYNTIRCWNVHRKCLEDSYSIMWLTVKAVTLRLAVNSLFFLIFFLKM